MHGEGGVVIPDIEVLDARVVALESGGGKGSRRQREADMGLFGHAREDWRTWINDRYYLYSYQYMILACMRWATQLGL